MGNQWIQDLVTMADAVIISADDAQATGGCCKFCKAPTDAANATHLSDCPVSLANRVLRQAGHLRAISGLRD